MGMGDATRKHARLNSSFDESLPVARYARLSSICRTLNTIHAVFLLLVSGFLLFNVVTLMMFSIGNWSSNILPIISLGLVVAAWGAAGGSLVMINPGKKSTIFAFMWYAVVMISVAAFFLSGID